MPCPGVWPVWLSRSKSQEPINRSSSAYTTATREEARARRLSFKPQVHTPAHLQRILPKPSHCCPPTTLVSAHQLGVYCLDIINWTCFIAQCVVELVTGGSAVPSQTPSNRIAVLHASSYRMLCRVHAVTYCIGVKYVFTQV